MMHSRTIVLVALVGSLALAPGAWAQTDVTGRIENFEPASRTLYFNDGRIVTLSPGATLWVDGREIPIETLRRGMTVVVRDDRASSGAQSASTDAGRPAGAAPALPAHPAVTASGTVARVDADNGVVTFQDGRSLKIERGQIWEASNLDDVHPGDQVLLQNARPTAYSALGTMHPDRTRMGRAIQVDSARSMVLLDNGTWVRLAPQTRMRLNGQAAQARTVILPGDELIIVVSEATQPQGGRSAAMAGGRQASPSDAPSAMAREGLVSRGDIVSADEVHIFRRHQSP
jgi:hypothetical protein